MVVGIGLNINETKNDFPEDLQESATSLSIETGHSNQRELVCAIITTFFEQLLNNLEPNIPIWESYCSHINNNVSFYFNNSKQTGIFKGINNSGYALIDIDNEIKTYPSIILK